MEIDDTAYSLKNLKRSSARAMEYKVIYMVVKLDFCNIDVSTFLAMMLINVVLF